MDERIGPFRTVWLLGLILLASFGLRLWGVHFGLPHLYHADEPIIVNHALAYGSGDLNPHFFKIPPLVSYLLFGVYGFFFLAGKAWGAWDGVRDFETFFYADPSAFYLIARLIFGVIAGTASVGLLFGLARKYLSSGWALLAAFFLGICFLHARDSHYVYADIPLIAVILAGFLAFNGLGKTAQPVRAHILSGIFIGLAAAVKYNGIFLAIPYAVCLIAPGRNFQIRFILAAAAASAIVFLIANPFAVLDHQTFLSELKMQSRSNTGVPFFHHLGYSLTGALGLPVLSMGLMGLAAAMIGRDRAKWLPAAAFTVGYYLAIVQWGQPYDRYVLLLLPFLILFFTYFISRIPEIFRAAAPQKPMSAAVLTFFLILTAALPNLIALVRFNQIMSADDVRTEAKAWVEENLPSGSSLALGWDFYMPRLGFTSAQLEEKLAAARDGRFSAAQLRRLRFYIDRSARSPSYELFFFSDRPESRDRFLFAGPLVAYELEALKAKGVEWVILPRLGNDPAVSSFRGELQRQAVLVKIFTPYRDPEITVPVDPQPLTGGPFLLADLLLRERNGQPIEIYRVKKFTG